MNGPHLSSRGACYLYSTTVTPLPVEANIMPPFSFMYLQILRIFFFYLIDHNNSIKRRRRKKKHLPLKHQGGFKPQDIFYHSKTQLQYPHNTPLSLSPRSTGIQGVQGQESDAERHGRAAAQGHQSSSGEESPALLSLIHVWAAEFAVPAQNEVLSCRQHCIPSPRLGTTLYKETLA